MEDQIVEEQVAQAPDTTELEAAYLQARDTYVKARDYYISIQTSGSRNEVADALENMLSKREQYARTYGALEFAGGTPEPPTQDPRYILRDRTPKREENYEQANQ